MCEFSFLKCADVLGAAWLVTLQARLVSRHGLYPNPMRRFRGGEDTASTEM